MVEEGFKTCLGSIVLGGEFNHDINCVEGVFECAAGHRFAAATQYQCTCGWSGVKACTTSGHDKRRPLDG